jgi:hypothetical protein
MKRDQQSIARSDAKNPRNLIEMGKIEAKI